MPNARTHCPYCNSRAVIDLAYLVRYSGVDCFQCRTCLEEWYVPKEKNWPPSKELLGHKK
jgi:formate dehydrogenase maturation protein FdhE